ncbi:hypothetical protein Cgig2_010989 [Carnegiea gigantea]|uniref:Peroxisome biogenesis protein 5 n=1 Tax=Carnegiea gigantea TaxID=171969 RepID=A0A9Q1JXR1_9CARY|nr:hypothetical protein Cgig2_010989 [Carnegiea gigantea]
MVFQVSRSGDKWINEFTSGTKQDFLADDKWVDEFSKLHVQDWVEEFGHQTASGEDSVDSWANAYDEYLNEQAVRQNPDSSKGVYVFSDMNPYVGHPDPLKEGQELFKKGLLSEAVLALEAEVLKNPDNAEGWRLLGVAHAENDDDQQAIASMMRAQEVDPTNLEVLLALGVSHTNVAVGPLPSVESPPTVGSRPPPSATCDGKLERKGERALGRFEVTGGKPKGRWTLGLWELQSVCSPCRPMGIFTSPEPVGFSSRPSLEFFIFAEETPHPQQKRLYDQTSWIVETRVYAQLEVHGGLVGRAVRAPGLDDRVGQLVELLSWATPQLDVASAGQPGAAYWVPISAGRLCPQKTLPFGGVTQVRRLPSRRVPWQP